MSLEVLEALSVHDGDLLELAANSALSYFRRYSDELERASEELLVEVDKRLTGLVRDLYDRAENLKCSGDIEDYRQSLRINGSAGRIKVKLLFSLHQVMNQRFGWMSLDRLALMPDKELSGCIERMSVAAKQALLPELEHRMEALAVEESVLQQQAAVLHERGVRLSVLKLLLRR